jgi:uncharacterized protein with PQ loop repeat
MEDDSLPSGEMENIWEKISFLAAVTMPIWNIPLIVRVIKRRSSSDISLGWVFGIWISFLVMAPGAYLSHDLTVKGFAYSNIVCFSVVVFVVMRYRKPPAV